MLTNKEIKLLDEICSKYAIQSLYIKELFSIEKDYADRNMAKRRGIYDKLDVKIQQWIEEEMREKNDI
ncbi:hypothetical protein EXW58_04715 [Bacillus mycoides]|uniref:hypothetical protein n=1 Tax=Bacillus mycoides TaxID=1405 RepID=UPI001C0381F5|nr:hypothetical protein [Bacillus mycoides]QWG26940.1 hypothetical protein EXW58_04715 [Bacillus mycoides]